MNKTKLLLLLCLITCTSQSMDPKGYSSEEEEECSLVGELLGITGGVDQKTKGTLVDDEFLTSFSRCSVKTIDSTRRSSEELRKSSVPNIAAQCLARGRRRASASLLGTPPLSAVKRRSSDSNLELKSKEPERKKRNISSLPSLTEEKSLLLEKVHSDDQKVDSYKKQHNK